MERFLAGWPTARIAEQLGVSRATVYKWVRRFDRSVEGAARDGLSPVPQAAAPERERVLSPVAVAAGPGRTEGPAGEVAGKPLQREATGSAVVIGVQLEDRLLVLGDRVGQVLGEVPDRVIAMFDHDRPVSGVSGVGGGGGAREAGDRDVIEMVDPEERVGFGVLYPQDRRAEGRHQIHEGGEQPGPVVDLGLPDRGIRIDDGDRRRRRVGPQPGDRVRLLVVPAVREAEEEELDMWCGVQDAALHLVTAGDRDGSCPLVRTPAIDA
ncbi:helix-turn-helix domain-containing protein [Pseudonocardia sp. T1-2H]|uniref:helix-turn-helix domain-containing protein n=1 Tax=Pseudonocardia sp. T1-2H TaxID=3128899 RepID=UPI004053B6F0